MRKGHLAGDVREQTVHQKRDGTGRWGADGKLLLLESQVFFHNVHII